MLKCKNNEPQTLCHSGHVLLSLKCLIQGLTQYTQLLISRNRLYGILPNIAIFYLSYIIPHLPINSFFQRIYLYYIFFDEYSHINAAIYFPKIYYKSGLYIGVYKQKCGAKCSAFSFHTSGFQSKNSKLSIIPSNSFCFSALSSSA